MAQDEHSNERPLQTWKDIAAYLERDVRTAMRWEKNAGLPIRRHAGAKGSSVYAYPSEIEAWRAGQTTESEPETPPLWRRPLTWAAGAVIAVAAAVIAYGPILNPKAPVAEAAEGSMRNEVVWTDAAASLSSRLSPDGKFLTYTDWTTGELWLRDLTTDQSRPVSNNGPWDKDASYPETSVMSPDGKRIAAGWFNDKIKGYELRVGPVPSPGETNDGESAYVSPRDQVGYVEAAGWVSNSRALFVHAFGFSTTRLAITDIEEKKTITLKTLEWSYPAGVTVSPDGRWVAYGLTPAPNAEQHDIRVLASDGSSESVVVEHPADDIPVAWTLDGSHLLFQSTRTAGESLWALPMANGRATAGPRMISPDLSVWRSLGVSAEGDLYYLKQTGSMDVQEARLDLETGRLIEPPKPIASSFVGSNIDPLYSPDGKWMAYISDRARHAFAGYDSRRIMVRELATGREHDLKPVGLGVPEMTWDRDSSSILFKGRDPKGQFGAYRFALRAAEPEPLFQTELRQKWSPSNLGWMADGESIHYRESWNDFRHVVRDVKTGTVRPLVQPKGRSNITLSPDGKRFSMIEHRREEGLIRLATVDAETGEQHELLQAPVEPKTHCCPPMAMAWAPDGKAILFWKFAVRNGGDPVPELWIAPTNGDTPRKTELTAPALARPNMLISLHPDGERIAFSAGDPKHEIWKLSNFLDRLTATD